MNKFKKIYIGLLSFIVGILSKMSTAFAVEMKYGVYDPAMIEDKYGVMEPTMGEKISKIGKFALPIVLFIIGLFVVLSKKIKRKTKIIVIFILIILAIIGYQLMNYIAMNF